MIDLAAEVWQAARLAAGEEVPGASPQAQALAQSALAAADRTVMQDLAEARVHIPSGKTGPRVSDAGKCGRQVWYRERPPADYTPQPMDESRAVLGGVVHDAAAAARAARYPWRLYEVAIPIPGLDRPGKFDEYDPVLGEVVDDKTAGSAKWAMVGDDGPTPDMWAQVMIYGLALEALGLPIRTVRIIVINRDTGSEESFRRDYDPFEAQDALDELTTLATLLDLGVVPVREGSSPRSFPCSWCPARRHCWNMQAAADAGRSPVSYTLLGEEPEDPTIEWAAATVHRLKQEATEAAKAAEVAMELLEGIRPGVYGDMEIKARKRDMPGYKEAFNRLLGFYAMPDGVRPPLEEVSEPPTRTDRWIEAKPVRAAQRRGAKGARC